MATTKPGRLLLAGAIALEDMLTARPWATFDNDESASNRIRRAGSVQDDTRDDNLRVTLRVTASGLSMSSAVRQA